MSKRVCPSLFTLGVSINGIKLPVLPPPPPMARPWPAPGPPLHLVSPLPLSATPRHALTWRPSAAGLVYRFECLRRKHTDPLSAPFKTLFDRQRCERPGGAGGRGRVHREGEGRVGVDRIITRCMHVASASCRSGGWLLDDTPAGLASAWYSSERSSVAPLHPSLAIQRWSKPRSR